MPMAPALPNTSLRCLDAQLFETRKHNSNSKRLPPSSTQSRHANTRANRHRGRERANKKMISWKMTTTMRNELRRRCAPTFRWKIQRYIFPLKLCYSTPSSSVCCALSACTPQFTLDLRAILRFTFLASFGGFAFLRWGPRSMCLNVCRYSFTTIKYWMLGMRVYAIRVSRWFFIKRKHDKSAKASLFSRTLFSPQLDVLSRSKLFAEKRVWKVGLKIKREFMVWLLHSMRFCYSLRDFLHFAALPCWVLTPQSEEEEESHNVITS